jgi:hypothetical protein
LQWPLSSNSPPSQAGLVHAQSFAPQLEQTLIASLSGLRLKYLLSNRCRPCRQQQHDRQSV